MLPHFRIFLLFSFFSTLLSECDIGGTWSTWLLSPYQTGYDFCGSSWKANWIRDCLSEADCPCNGPTEFFGEMNIQVCPPPREKCCPGYSNSEYNGIDACINSTSGQVDVTPIVLQYWAMLPHFRIFLLFSFFSTLLSECDIGGTWSTWLLSPYQTGYDFCGSSWKANWIRKCLSAPECPCNGPTVFTGEMNTGLCLYPRFPSCYPGYLKGIFNGTLKCVNNVTKSLAIPPIDETPLPNDTYCPPSGVGIWSSWSEWENGCSATCGQFGTTKRTRTCLSEAYGCPCFASDIGPCQTAPCPWTPCPGEPKCRGPLVTSNDGQLKYCYPFEATPLIGSWTEWIPVSNSNCSDTCGMFGQAPSQRFCHPPGSDCEGDYKRTKPCPQQLCTDGRAPCNDGYQITTLDDGTKICTLKV